VRRAVLAFALLLAACQSGGGAPTPPSGSSSPSEEPSRGPSVTTTPSPSPPTGTPSPSPTIEPLLHLPADAPTTFDGEVGASGPFEALVPPGAEVLDAWFAGPVGDQPAFAWVVWGRGADPFARELGVVLWQRFADAPAWRATHAFTNPPAKGVLGISLAAADLTGDGITDALTFEQTGGSGACGRWRVVAPFAGGAVEAFDHRTCDAQVTIAGDHLELREAVFAPGDAHCCPSAYRITTLEWDGETFAETAVREDPASSTS
jgi:hypothetical protein